MPIYYEAKSLERAIDAAPRITPSTKSMLKKIIRSAPAADVEPVVHGEWIVCGDGADVPFMCSHCGKTVAASHKRMYDNYCPSCGAKMDLEVTDNG